MSSGIQDHPRPHEVDRESLGFIGAYMNRIIIAKGGKDHAEQPPRKEPRCVWLIRVDRKDFQSTNCHDWNGHSLFEHLGPLGNGVILHGTASKPE